MSGYEQYLDKKTQKKLNIIDTGFKEKTLEEWQREQMPSSIEEFRNMYDTNAQKKSAFEDRTESYFQDAGLTSEKVEKYTSNPEDVGSLKDQQAYYQIFGTSKRNEYSEMAEKAFEEAANIQQKQRKEAILSGKQKDKDIERYQRDEKVVRLKMAGMVDEAKHRSKNDTERKYKVLKAKYSCLSVLKNELDVIIGSATTERDQQKFEAIKEELLDEIHEVEKELTKVIPTAYRIWEEEHGILRRRPYNTKKKSSDAYKALSIDNSMALDELLDIMDGAMENKPFDDDAPYEDRQKMYMAISHPMYVVRKDSHGFPMSNIDLKKFQWNNRWKDAIKNGDTATKEIMRKAAYNRRLEYKFPTQQELEEKGIEYFFNNDPTGLYEVMRMGATFDNMTEVDSFVKQYLTEMPQLKDVILMAQKMFVLYSDRETQKYYDKAMKADNDDDMRQYLEQSYTSMDYAAFGLN